MSRIIAGSAGGRRLAAPPGKGTRPTSDRAREGLFSTLEALHGPLAGARFADLYAGSGAVGLEALSRGAAHALLVEADARAAAVCRSNARALGVPGAVVVEDRVERVLATAPAERYDVVFVDPPYADPVAAVLESLAAHGWLAAGAVVAVERATRGEPPGWPEGLEPVRSRRYGEATVHYALWYGR